MHDVEAIAAAGVDCHRDDDCDWGVAGGAHSSRLEVAGVRKQCEAVKAVRSGQHSGRAYKTVGGSQTVSRGRKTQKNTHTNKHTHNTYN